MSILALFFLCVCLVTAAPSSSSTYNASTAMNALYFCKASYCDISALNTWTCNSCSYHPRFQLYATYSNNTWDMQAFTGYDPDTNRVVVAFRGSYNIPNWIADLTVALIPYANASCEGCQVHKGFYEVYQEMASAMLPDIVKLLSAHPGAQAFITGHSLGAAVAFLMAIDVQNTIQPRDLLLYDFGEPRVGDPAFATWAASVLSGNHFRVVHNRDPVPHVPPMSWGYLHSPHELWYNDYDPTQPFHDCNDSASSEDPNCSNGVIALNILDHLEYLGVCTLCSCL